MTDQPSRPDSPNESDQLAPHSAQHQLGHPGRQLGRAFSQSISRRVTPSASGNDLSPAYLWRVFCRWWKWVVPLGILLSIGAGAVVCLLWVPKYEAVALVKIESEAPFIAFNQGTVVRKGDLYVQTQIELLRSPVVLAPLLGRPEIASISEINQELDPIKFLQKNLSVTQVGKSELHRVSYVNRSAKDAATVANLVVAEYLRMQDREEKQRSHIVIDVLEKERLERGARVELLRNRVVALARELTGKDPFGLGIVSDISAFSPVSTLYQSLTEADVNMEVLKAELQSLQNAPILAADKAAAAGLLDLEISNRPDIRQLDQRLTDIQDYILAVKDKHRAKIGDTWQKDPQHLRLQKLKAETQAELDQLKIVARNELIAQETQQRNADQQRRIADKMKELATLDARRDMLTQKFDKHLQDMKSEGAQTAELEFAKAELEREEKVFELIAARKLALQTEMRAPARVSLMQTANVPAIAVEPIPYKLLLIACALALVAPFGLAVAHELVVRRISDSEQLQQETTLPILGEVARFPSKFVTGQPQVLPAASQRQLYLYAESIDSLRTNLLLTENLGAPGNAKVVAVCSAASGEGKTSLATALAMSIAKATTQPTLVLDADMREPDAANFFEIAQQQGVAEVLSGDLTVEQAIHRVGDTEAYLMPAGKSRANPHHLIHGTAIVDLLNKLRETFTTIVIDTPPILSASESLVYAKAADSVVFCSLCGVSRVKQVRKAVERLHSTGAHLCGAVLSGIGVRRYAYHYGYREEKSQ